MRATHLSFASITAVAGCLRDSCLIGLECSGKVLFLSLAQGWLVLWNSPIYITFLNSSFYQRHQRYLPQNKQVCENMLYLACIFMETFISTFSNFSNNTLERKYSWQNICILSIRYGCKKMFLNTKIRTNIMVGTTKRSRWQRPYCRCLLYFCPF